MGSWRMIEAGHHVERVSGLHVVRGLDDSDGHDRPVWVVWSADPRKDGMALTGPLGTVHDAKRRASFLAVG